MVNKKGEVETRKEEKDERSRPDRGKDGRKEAERADDWLNDRPGEIMKRSLRASSGREAQRGRCCDWRPSERLSSCARESRRTHAPANQSNKIGLVAGRWALMRLPPYRRERDGKMLHGEDRPQDWSTERFGWEAKRDRRDLKNRRGKNDRRESCVRKG